MRYACAKPRRFAILQDPANALVNGIDFVEVVQDANGLGATLTLRLARPAALDPSQIAIEGGVRFRAPHVVSAVPSGNEIVLRTDGPSDFSTYTLRLRKSPGSDLPPAGFDPELAAIAFSFKADCPSPFDCAAPEPDGVPSPGGPPVDYLAKDYESFRTLMLDRLSTTLPDWKERSPADLGVALVEVLAHGADVLSQYQDAVATEAYLGTARRRTSVRRHARLLDYPMHDGCSARVWVAFEVGNQVNLPLGTALLVRREGQPAALPANAAENPLGPGFETMHAATLWPELNQVQLHGYFDEDCDLAMGATRATLWDETGALSEPLPNGTLRRLPPGTPLLFEEVRDERGSEADADPARRHVVRITSAKARTEALVWPGEAKPRQVVEIEWHAQDALPFALGLTTPDGPRTLVRGNLVLADHGLAISEDEPPFLLENGEIRLRRGPVSRRGRSRGQVGAVSRGLDNKPLPFDPEGPAATAAVWSFADVFPEVSLLELDGDAWLPERDLLGAGPYSKSFVLESENDGVATVRFGDGQRGMRPDPSRLRLQYRIGNGKAGMVGAEAIGHVALPNPDILSLRNPMPSFGGTDPEPLSDVKTVAPYAFLRKERAVTDDDFAELAQRHPEVQRAVAYRRWTGSWTVVTLLIDRLNGRPIDGAFQAELQAMFERYRMAGYDIEIAAPVAVPLDLAITVCCEPDAFRSHVHAGLRDSFSNAPGGFFDPNRLVFGQPVFVSEVVARAMAVPGVQWVDLDDTPPKPNRFKRFGRASDGAFLAGQIVIGAREIARLDNDPSRPENGRIEFFMGGGR